MDKAADTELSEFMAGRWSQLVRLGYGLTGDAQLAEDRLRRVHPGVRVVGACPAGGRPGCVPAADRDQRQPEPVPQAPPDVKARGQISGPAMSGPVAAADPVDFQEAGTSAYITLYADVGPAVTKVTGSAEYGSRGQVLSAGAGGSPSARAWSCTQS